MYIPRTAETTLETMGGEFRAVAVVGPRQSGKTTLVRRVFSDKPYVSFEDPDALYFATSDPRGFLAGYPGGAIFDEAQRCPQLFSYLQGVIDSSHELGRFVLTGSQNFGLVEQISQSLAGRVGFLTLLPLSLRELSDGSHRPTNLNQAIYNGGYPPIHDVGVSPERWYNSYVNTYLERDMRQMIQVHDLDRFQRFMKLCAGNIGQLVNMTRIGADCGVNQHTIKAWLGILEAGFIAYRLRPHHENFRKRLVKAPKMYFYDVGLAARLLGIETQDQLGTHHMRGPLFENWVVTELLKMRFNSAKNDNLYFWRNNIGQEIDVIADRAGMLLPVEVKSGMTVASDWLEGLEKWRRLAGNKSLRPHLIYGGDSRQSREAVEILPWFHIGELDQMAQN